MYDNRRVSEITEVVGVNDGEIILNKLYELNGEGKLEWTGNYMKKTNKLRNAGLLAS